MNPNTFVYDTPRIIEDYSQNHGVDELEKMLQRCAISGQQAPFHELSLKDQQILLVMLFKEFASSKELHTLKKIAYGLICYVQNLDSTQETEVNSFATKDFTELMLRPTTYLELACDAKIGVLQNGTARERQTKQTEWQNTLKIFQKLTQEHIPEDPVPLFSQILHEYKVQVTPTSDKLAFALCRLAEVLYFLNQLPYEDVERLHQERLSLLSEFIKTEDDTTLKLQLFAQALKEKPAHPAHSPLTEMKWIAALNAQELDIVVQIITSPHTPEATRNGLIEECKCDIATTKSREFAQRIEDTMLLKKVPLKAFLEGENIDSYLECLHSILRGYRYHTFQQFSPREMRANFLLFLACSMRQSDSRSITLVLLSLPYCIQYLDGLCSEELSQSLDSSEEDFAYALSRRIEHFLVEDEEKEAEALACSTAEWPSMNQVLRHIAACQIEEPLIILEQALIAWKAFAKPDPKELAFALRACADFALGLTSVEDSIRTIAYHLISCLGQDDEVRIKAFPAENHDELYMIKVLFYFLKLEGYELDGKNPQWTTTLEGRELELFIALANSTRAASRVRSALFPFYTKKGASEKCLQLAIRLAPALDAARLIKLASKLQEPALSLFVDTVNNAKFPPDNKLALIRHFFHTKTIEAIHLAARLSPNIDLSSLTAFLKTVDEITPCIAVTKEHQDTLRCLCNATWLNDRATKIFTLEDAKAKELLALLDKVANKFWLEDELKAAFFIDKISSMIQEVIISGRKSPAPEPSLRPKALKMSSSELLPLEPVEVFKRVVQKDFGQQLLNTQ